MTEATSAYLNRPCRSYEEARRDSYTARRALRQRADRQHLRLMVRNTIIDIKSWRAELANIEATWPDYPTAMWGLRWAEQDTRLRYLHELRSQHTVLIRLRRAAE